jgi:hypothetical protein
MQVHLQERFGRLEPESGTPIVVKTAHAFIAEVHFSVMGSQAASLSPPSAANPPTIANYHTTSNCRTITIFRVTAISCIKSISHMMSHTIAIFHPIAKHDTIAVYWIIAIFHTIANCHNLSIYYGIVIEHSLVNDRRRQRECEKAHCRVVIAVNIGMFALVTVTTVLIVRSAPCLQRSLE